MCNTAIIDSLMIWHTVTPKWYHCNAKVVVMPECFVLSSQFFACLCVVCESTFENTFIYLYLFLFIQVTKSSVPSFRTNSHPRPTMTTYCNERHTHATNWTYPFMKLPCHQRAGRSLKGIVFSPKQSFLSFSPSGWRGNCFTALGGWACGLAAGPNLAEHLWNHWMDFFVQSSVHLLRPAVVKRHSHPHMGQTHYGPNEWPMRNWYSFQPLNLVKGCPFSDLWVVGCCSLNVF